jgi:hypothetical protein
VTSSSSAEFVRRYLQRVVNERDLGAVDMLVSPDFRGSGYGWPPDLDGLRRLYVEQAEYRPDWHITVEETMEVGEWVAVRATAGGSDVRDPEVGGVRPRRRLEWLAVFRVVDDRLVETRIVSLLQHE